MSTNINKKRLLEIIREEIMRDILLELAEDLLHASKDISSQKTSKNIKPKK